MLTFVANPLLRLLYNLPHHVYIEALSLIYWWAICNQQVQRENNTFVYKDYIYFSLYEFPCYEYMSASNWPYSFSKIEKAKSSFWPWTALSHWINLFCKTCQDLTAKQAEEQKRHDQFRRNVDMDSYDFKYGAVRNTVSSSKSQANATQSAIDVRGEGGGCIAPRTSADNDDLVIF